MGMRTNAPITAWGALLVALGLAACGGGGSQTAAPTSPAATSQGTLFDRSGHAIYTPEQEADGRIHCTGACLSFWKPVRPGQLDSATAKLGTVRRPGGGRQVTIDGKPVYTFSEDSPGAVTGDGFSDAFGGRHFTWHVVTAGGKASGTSGTGGRYGY